MKDKKAAALEQFMTVVYENGYSSNMVKGMLLTEALYLEFGRNQELSEEQMFTSTIRIAERTNMLPKTELQAFNIGVTAAVRLLYYDKTNKK